MSDTVRKIHRTEHLDFEILVDEIDSGTPREVAATYSFGKLSIPSHDRHSRILGPVNASDWETACLLAVTEAMTMIDNGEMS